MKDPVECVPNFSEGRDSGIVEAVSKSAAEIPGCFVLDLHSDYDHHRSVLTLAGEAEAVLEAMIRVAEECVRRIDLRRHHGVHPRVGALDVVPFIPLGATTMEVCIRLAERFGQEVGQRLSLPTFLYGEAARDESRRELAWVRRGGLEGLARDIGRDPDRAPDFGPELLHPSAGAVAAGARGPLIAFNLLLAPPAGLDEAREVARRVRGLASELPGVKALGFFLPRRERAQVSMNLVDHRTSAPSVVVEAVASVVQELGLEIQEGELVGLMPAVAAPGNPAAALRLPNWAEDNLLEVRWRRVIGEDFP